MELVGVPVEGRGTQYHFQTKLVIFAVEAAIAHTQGQASHTLLPVYDGIWPVSLGMAIDNHHHPNWVFPVMQVTDVAALKLVVFVPNDL